MLRGPAVVAAVAITMGIVSFVGPQAGAADSSAPLVDRIEALERELQTMKDELAEAKEDARAAKNDAASAKKEARAEESVLTKWHLSGYSVANFSASDAAGADTTFGPVKFNPGIHFQYKDWLLFESELELEIEDDTATNLELEFASLNFFATDYLTIVAGKFLSPIGQFQERLHPEWINKMPDRPAGFAGGAGILPLNEVGVMLRGGVTVNPMFNYSVYIGNGPQVELSAGELEKVELEGFGSDDNNNKAVGGRVGVLPIPEVEVGVSLLTSQIEGKKGAVAGDVTEGDFFLWAADASYTDGPVDLRFEYLSSELDTFFSQAEPGTATELIPTTEWEAWYVQAAYQLSGITDEPITRNLEPVVRYGQSDAKGFGNFVTEANPEDRLTIGLNYLFAPSVIGKLAVSWRDFENGEDATELKLQGAYGF